MYVSYSEFLYVCMYLYVYVYVYVYVFLQVLYDKRIPYEQQDKNLKIKCSVDNNQFFF